MNVIVIGIESDVERFRKRFPNQNVSRQENAGKVPEGTDLIVWFQSGFPLDETVNSGIPLLIDSTYSSLERSLSSFQLDQPVGGFTSLPTFFEREIFEVSLLREEHKSQVSRIVTELGTNFEIVSDRVGLVTPRVIAMIINEAYYTVSDGTANRSDIDIAMKKGTNYPYGPFEWKDLIGAENLLNLLKAVYRETGESRYQVSQLLEDEAATPNY